MSRPSTIWLAFVACALLLAGALAVVSRHALGLERERVEAEAEADAGQRVRLALWRMDSEATAILVRENNRQPADFVNPDPPADAPPGARLYFEINQKGELLAPARADVSGAATDRRAELRRLLHLMDAPAARLEQASNTSHQDGQANVPAQAVQLKDMQQVQNADLAIAAANVGNAAKAEAVGGMPMEEDNMLAKEAPAGGVASANAPPAVAKPAVMSKSAAKESVQSKLDANELNQRAKAVQKSTNRYNSQQEEPSKVARPAEAAAPRPASAPAAAPAPQALGRGASSRPQPTPMPSVDKARAAGDRDAAVSQVFAAPQEDQATPRVTEDSRVTSLQPVWIDGELLLVRAVGDGLRQRVQGIWIDHKAMGASLLDAIRDLLPAATLAPYEPFVFTRDNLVRPGATAGLAANRLTAIPRSLEDVPMAMVSMPWVLVPGMAPAPAAAGSALGILLGSAWAGALLAIAAAAFLLRGVLVLSERRAAFVSSVTHELRTPLTTFTLYSEMLADGMVKDPEKQRGYLQTLRTEAARLGHLVENVLAYSRIERGSARTRMEDINIQTLADRLMPRLAERATGVGATIDICLPADLAGRTLTTDASAVEQIVFNLVDNAAKYAPPAAGGPPWQLVFAITRGQLAIDFRDHGPGIPPAGRKRLFRPFHKSAQDAANSKPGVGLGLALSRRLAHALGGSLDLAESSATGTTFRLVLPMARRFDPR